MDLARALGPGVILMDLRMPGMDGDELVRAIRAIRTAARGEAVLSPLLVI